VIKIAERVLSPVARAPLGPIELMVSGRTLREEERRVRATIDRMLEGRGGDRLEGVDDLVRIVVEIRALPARRLLTACLRLWHPAHVVATGMLLGLLLLHVFQMTRW
jgi:hypothetical protein